VDNAFYGSTVETVRSQRRVEVIPRNDGDLGLNNDSGEKKEMNSDADVVVHLTALNGLKSSISGQLERTALHSEAILQLSSCVCCSQDCCLFRSQLTNHISLASFSETNQENQKPKRQNNKNNKHSAFFIGCFLVIHDNKIYYEIIIK
ncbi:hypothetical protein H1C71_011417, partial [Ictidomys tridecemlineatus]